MTKVKIACVKVTFSIGQVCKKVAEMFINDQRFHVSITYFQRKDTIIAE
jgi:hypothetical protein